MIRSLDGKVALVTGASRGIGRAIALSLAAAGADCVVTATTQPNADKVAREIAARGGKALPLGCDVGRPGDVRRLVDAVHSVFRGIDILVNNAGIIHRAPLAELTDADFDRVLAVNLSGPFYLSRRLAPLMVKRRWGRIINISSISGTIPCPRALAYAASKWGLDGLTKSMAEELKGTGVFVAAVLPGSVATEMLEGSGFTARISPEEVARVVRFLCVDAPESMTGSLVEVFG